MAEPSTNVSLQPPVAKPSLPLPPATSIFRGPNGIRAGWRALIFLLIFAALAIAVNLGVWLVRHFLLHAASHFQMASSLSPAAAILSDGPLLLFSGLAALIMSRIEHRKWAQYGLPPAFAFRQDFWVGTFVGFLAISTSL